MAKKDETVLDVRDRKTTYNVAWKNYAERHGEFMERSAENKDEVERAFISGAAYATATQLRKLADLANAVSTEEISDAEMHQGDCLPSVPEATPTPGIERMTWGGLTSSHAIPSRVMGDRGPVLYISIRDELIRMGFEIPEEGSTELFALEDQIEGLVPEFNAIFKDFQGAVNNSATETQVRHRIEGLVLKAIETGRLSLKRTWGKRT